MSYIEELKFKLRIKFQSHFSGISEETKLIATLIKVKKPSEHKYTLVAKAFKIRAKIYDMKMFCKFHNPQVTVFEILSAIMVHLWFLIASYENMFPGFSFSHLPLSQCHSQKYLHSWDNDLLFLPNNDTIITHLGFLKFHKITCANWYMTYFFSPIILIVCKTDRIFFSLNTL